MKHFVNFISVKGAILNKIYYYPDYITMTSLGLFLFHKTPLDPQKTLYNSAQENMDTCILDSAVSVSSYVRSLQHGNKVKPSVNPAVDWMCMDGWSVELCAECGTVCSLAE